MALVDEGSRLHADIAVKSARLNVIKGLIKQHAEATDNCVISGYRGVATVHHRTEKVYTSTSVFTFMKRFCRRNKIKFGSKPWEVLFTALFKCGVSNVEAIFDSCEMPRCSTVMMKYHMVKFHGGVTDVDSGELRERLTRMIDKEQ